MFSPRSHLVKVALVVAALLVIVCFSPNMTYLGVKYGWIELVRPSDILGLKVELTPEWFPIASNESVLGKVLIQTSYVPTVIYYKNDWTRPWNSLTMAMARLGKETTNNAKAEKAFAWGAVVDQTSPMNPTLKIYYVPQYALSISTRDTEVQKSIVSISRR